MITGIKLKNWRSHLDSSIEFTDGTNALLGHMGSGKTTILDSICFAFFGTFPILQSKKIKLDDLIMNKPSLKEMAEVEVFFQTDGKDYSVKRVVEKRKGTAYSELRENGKLIEAPSTQRVNELVEKILKVNYDLFSKAIYSEQNALDYFLTIPKGQRMRKIDELLTIDKFEKARSNAGSLANKVLERKSSAQMIMDNVNANDLDVKIKEIKSSLQSLISEKVQSEVGVKSTKQRRMLVEIDLQKLRRMKDDFEILKREERGLSSGIDELYRSIMKVEQKLSNIDKENIGEAMKSSSDLLDEMTRSLEENSIEYQKLSNEYFKFKTEADVYKREIIDKLEKELGIKLAAQKEADLIKKKIGRDPDKQLEKRKLAVEKYVGELESLRIKMSDLAEVIEQLSSVKATCPVCEARLTDEKKIVLIKSKREKITKLQANINDALKKKEITETELRQLMSMLDRLDDILNRISDFDKLSSDLDTAKDIYKVLSENSIKMEAEIKIMKQNLAEMQKKMVDVRNSRGELELLNSQIHEYNAGKRRIEELTSQRSLIVSHLQQLEKSFVGVDIRKLEEELMELAGKEKEFSTKMQSFDQLVFERENRLKELENAYNTIVKERDEIRKLDQVAIQLRIFEKSLEATQIQLRQEFITAVNYSMNQLWQTLYPYRDFADIRLNVEEGDYVLQLLSRNEWINVEGIVSGGERSLAALTLRVALSLILAPHLRMLFLDEPTSNLDAKAIEELSTTLRERIHEFIDQTFIITHESELENAVTGHAYRLQRDKVNDGYTEIVKLN
ncbi:MAG: SMC family ATPase [Candidatus Aenigmarchaeota archaeon]|nr:SMC family ATPase [Candidatus Aenigmarchaeota archaeon]